MAPIPDPNDKPAGPQGHAARQRKSAGSVNTPPEAGPRQGTSDIAPGPPHLQAIPPNLQTPVASKGPASGSTSQLGGASASKTAERPRQEQMRPSSAPAAPSQVEEELLDEDEVMEDQEPAQRPAPEPTQGAVPAATRANAAAMDPKNTLAAAALGAGKRKKHRRGGRRHCLKVTGQADVSARRVEPSAPRAAKSPPSQMPAPASRSKEKAPRPAVAESRMAAWDKLPARLRRVYSTQERQAFRKHGVLVSRFDMQLYHAVTRFNAGGLFQIFPRPPKWWPGSWGELPVTLPWEVCLYRSQLIAATDAHPLWSEVYQGLLEQLAKGWDVHFQEVSDRSQIAALPPELASAMLRSGAFAFAEGPSPLPSFQLFLERHEWRGDVPDQRIAQIEAWGKIRPSLALERPAAPTLKSAACDCSDRLVRAATRLGLVAKVLDATPELDVEDLQMDGERLAAIAAAALSYSLTSARVLSDAWDCLHAEGESAETRLGRVKSALEQYEPLYRYFPSQFREDCSRLRARKSAW